LPVLSPAFKKVYAVDISANNLQIAKKNYPQYTNVEYLLADMSTIKPKSPIVILLFVSMLSLAAH
jgi:ubiquinone/menaquinone biosynthesis C-methylase UbiE